MLVPDEKTWVIYDKTTDLYWSNDLGWITDDNVTIFGDDEHNYVNLPMGGEWKQYT
jgi:hypothetical protein